MAIKVVLLFQMTTNTGPFPGIPAETAPAPAPSIGYAPRVHLGGWSESLWWDANTLGPLLAALKTGYGGKPGLCPSRAALLPAYTSIIGARFYSGGAGKGQSVAFSFPGTAEYHNDVPQMAILVKAAPASAAVARRFTLRGIPDSVIKVGEFAPDVTYAGYVAEFFKALGNFSFYAVDPASPVADIFNVTAGGLVTTKVSPQPFLVGQIVTLQKVVDAAGAFKTFTGVVTTIGPMAGNFTIATWPHGAGTGGKATIKLKTLFQISSPTCAVSRAVVRKVGRPFEQYRGRRSKRKPKE